MFVGSLALARPVKKKVAMITAYKRDIRRVLRDESGFEQLAGGIPGSFFQRKDGCRNS